MPPVLSDNLDSQNSPRMIKAPTTVFLTAAALILGAGGGIPLYRVAAAPSSHDACLSFIEDSKIKSEKFENRIRELELESRTAAEWRRGVDEKLVEIGNTVKEIRDHMENRYH